MKRGIKIFETLFSYPPLRPPPDQSTAPYKHSTTSKKHTTTTTKKYTTTTKKHTTTTKKTTTKPVYKPSTTVAAVTTSKFSYKSTTKVAAVTTSKSSASAYKKTTTVAVVSTTKSASSVAYSPSKSSSTPPSSTSASARLPRGSSCFSNSECANNCCSDEGDAGTVFGNNKYYGLFTCTDYGKNCTGQSRTGQDWDNCVDSGFCTSGCCGTEYTGPPPQPQCLPVKWGQGFNEDTPTITPSSPL